MRLVQVKVQKKNVLSSAIHNIHGLVWTTGTAILLTEISEVDKVASPCRTIEDCHQRKSNITLGEFSAVDEVCWSDFDSATPLLSAIHKETEGAQPALEVWEFLHSEPSLQLKSILKQHLPHQPSNYGCMVWNSRSSKLCVVLRGSAHVYCAEKMTRFFRPVFGNFTCGVWSQDSTQLLLSTDTSVVLYDVTNMQTQLLEVLYIVNASGVIAAIAPSPNLYLCARELPLQDLIQKSSHNVLSSHIYDVSTTSQLLGEIVPAASTSSSCIALISSQGVVVTTVSLDGMLTPNLLSWCAEKCWCVVGSSSARSLQIVSVYCDVMEKLHQISIPTNKRAKGIAIAGGEGDKLFTAIADVFPGDNQLFPHSLREKAWMLTISSLSLSAVIDNSSDNSSITYLPVSMDAGIENVIIPTKPIETEQAGGDFQLASGRFPRAILEQFSGSYSGVDPVIHTLTENLKQQLKLKERDSNYERHKELTSVSQQQRELTSVSQRHKELTSVSQRHKELTSVSQQHKELTSVSQQHKELTSVSQQHKELTSVSQQHKELTSVSRYSRHRKEPIQNKQVVPVQRKNYAPCTKSHYKIREVAEQRNDVYESMNDIATVDVFCLYVDTQGSKISEKVKRFLLTTGGLLSVEMLTRVFEVEEIEIKTGNMYAAFTPTEDGYVPIKFKHSDKFAIRGIVRYLQ